MKSPVYAVHEYELRAGVSPEQFEQAVRQAVKRNLFDLPGLVEYRFLKGIKGERTGRYAALWIFESLEAWEKLWGPPAQPFPKERYPKNWLIWEDEILAPLLDRDPDKIVYTDYVDFLVSNAGAGAGPGSSHRTSQ